MSAIDWSILVGFTIFISAMAYSTKKYTKSVADFLAANRCAGKYLLAMGDGMAGLGAISIVAGFQVYLEGGFTRLWWWESLWYPVSIFCAISGWVIYRFRQTRVLTMAQFFEIRYSKSVRVFAGILAFLSGIINFGIFPSVGARFFMYFCRLPMAIGVFGYEIDTYAVVMALLIAIALGFTCLGGQIAVLLTDFIQSVFCNIVFIVVIVALFLMFDWDQIASAVSARPENESMVNPFQIGNLKNYDLFFYFIAIFNIFYGAYTWQGQQAYNTSARDAHQAKMSKVLGYLRILTPNVFVIMLALCSYTLIHHADFSSQANIVNESLSQISNEQIRNQMTVPLAMSQVLPTGLAGLLCAVMFAAFVSTHDTYMHSWGSILLQDIILPLRKKAFTPQEHIKYLRYSIIGVAVFIFLFSYFVIPQIDIIMFFALAGTIFLGAAGVVVIGGLYWKRGTTAGAWAALAVGLIMAILGFVFVLGWTRIAVYLQNAWPDVWLWLKGISPQINSEEFLFSAYELYFFTEVVCALTYVVVSLLTQKETFNLDRMLHRGRYAIEQEKTPEDDLRTPYWKKAIGFSRDMSWDDKLMIVCAYSYAFLALGTVLLGTIWHLCFGISDEMWLAFWHGYCWFFFGFLIIFTIWLGIGGCFDVKKLFSMLGTAKRNDDDDGRVVDHHNSDEKD